MASPAGAGASGGAADPDGPVRRDPGGGIVGGVVAGVAAKLRADVGLLRVLFAIGVFVSGGLLLVAYAFAWLLIPAGGGPRPAAGVTAGRWGRGRGGWHLGFGVGLLTLSALLVFRELGVWWSDALVWPLVLAAAGAAVLWGASRRPAPVAAADPWSGAGSDPPTGPGEEATPFAELYRGGFGVALVVGAALLFLSANDALGPARDAAFTAVVAIVALALVLAPFIWRLGRSLAEERGERIRSQERAEVAAHLHDSVLQTLTLMQKRAADPRAVSALARRQERELRSWLAGDSPTLDGGFAAALRRAAAEVEDAHLVAIEVVVVGDCPLDERAGAVVAAAGEAMTNAAKFAPGGPISLYAEVTPERVDAFVRDRGAGFDPEAVAADRRGVRDSIVGRMERHGGVAKIHAVPESGTEVELSIDRERP